MGYTTYEYQETCDARIDRFRQGQALGWLPGVGQAALGWDGINGRWGKWGRTIEWNGMD